MKKLAFVAIMLVPGLGLAAIEGSRHDLALGGGASTTHVSETQVCAFCHTPHGAETGTTAIWNRTTSDVTGWVNGEVTAYGTTLPALLTATANAGTARCMSCHDGSTTLGAVRRLNGVDGPLDPAANWTVGNVVTGVYDIYDAVDTSLAGNHPVGVPYPDGTASLYNGVTSGVTDTADWVGSPTGVKLYPPDSGTLTGVECGSCHDPHGDETDFFLRTGSADSAICKACHSK